MQKNTLSKALAACGSPDTLVAAILAHYPDLRAPVQIEPIAHDAGISECGDIDEKGIVCATLSDVEKTKGVLQSAAGLSAQRRRFANAHALGHYLLKAHRGDRRCTNRDLGEKRTDTPHRKEEMQANRFAAGLLMPKPWFVDFVADLGKPTVAHMPMIAAEYDVSLEAAAGRYVELTQGMYALVFVKDGVVRYMRLSRSFPTTSIRAGDPAPAAIAAVGPQDKIAWLPANVRDWVLMSRDMRPPKVTMQVLSKENGFQLVMLFINAAAEKRADEEAEKAAMGGPKFGDGRRG
ncbi:MAG: ImmA/IrrE family metallo-endopeptidase [Rhizorhabdus sp.]|nr:ImmA/IrrE family metallo-endopeptidase [Rhizorhabdus sp.]